RENRRGANLSSSYLTVCRVVPQRSLPMSCPRLLPPRRHLRLLRNWCRRTVNETCCPSERTASDRECPRGHNPCLRADRPRGHTARCGVNTYRRSSHCASGRECPFQNQDRI